MTDHALGQDLTGRLAVVTGGAQGIGRSIVEALGGIPNEFQVSPDYFLYLAIARLPA